MDELDLHSGFPFTASMARARGVSTSRLRRWVRDGRVRQVLHGVYVAAAATDSIDLRAGAARLVLPEHAVVCDLSAAWLHGIDLFEFAELDLIPRLDVVSIAGCEGSERRGVFGGKRALDPRDIETVDGVRVTTPLRTACDVARLRGRSRAIAALDAFRREFGISPADLQEMIPRFVGQRGVIQLRELAPLATDQADSQAESWVRLMIHDAGFPMPEAQVWVLLPEWGHVRVENAWPHLRIAVEYDGEEFHTSDEDRDHDRRRRKALRAAGWIIIVVRKDGLGQKARARWLAELAKAISQRTPETKAKRVYSRGPDHPSYPRRTRRRK